MDIHTSDEITLNNKEIIIFDKDRENTVLQVNPEVEVATQTVSEPLFSQGIIAGVVGLTTTMGGWIGGFLGREAGLELGKNLREDAEKRIIATVNNTTEQLLEDYHINNNMTKHVLENEVGRLVRREIGDKIEDACIEQGTQKGTAIGSALVGGATLLFMAGANYGYSCYKQYSEEQSKARAAAINAKNIAALMTDDQIIDDFVMVEGKESPNNNLTI